MSNAESGWILVVDDAASSRSVLARWLENAGYRVSLAADGLAALAHIAQAAPDIVLLDLIMPGMSGLEVLAKVRETWSSAELPIIMITAEDSSPTIVAALDAGANDFIAKPVDPPVCRARIRTQLALKRMNAELRARNFELERLNREKNQLLGMAAHDLRNPLSVIRFYSEFLSSSEERTVTEGQRRQFLEAIASTSDFMLGLVNDLLSVASLESGNLQLNRQETDLGALIKRNVELNRVVAAAKSMTIQLDLPAALPRLSIDPAKTEQVLNNLITNAVKYSPPPNSIDVSAALIGPAVTVSVTDRGPGIPAAEIGQLFQPFQRASSVQSTGGEQSTGLGLAIARRIVEGHGGRIGLDSEVGRGSKFWFSLPVRQG